MNRLTDNDKNWGPFTLARWNNSICAKISSGDDEDPECELLFVALGWALRTHIPTILKPWGKYSEHRREYGFRLGRDGKWYDFLTLYYGPQTHDSSTTRSWSYFLPWTQKRMVRHSWYRPDGSLFCELRGRGFRDFYDQKEKCPKAEFQFSDYDGEVITATCVIEEREWLHGAGWCKWLGWFVAPYVRRSLDLRFSAEVGPEKGSWKGGTLGHGIDMVPNETPQSAFERYCAKKHCQKGQDFSLTFIGPVESPTSTPVTAP